MTLVSSFKSCMPQPTPRPGSEVRRRPGVLARSIRVFGLPPTPASARGARGLSLLVLILFPMLDAGCRSSGALMYKAFGPPPVPAKFVLAKQRTLVVVENYRNPALSEFDADRIARDVVKDLEKHESAPMVDVDQLARLRETNADGFRAMTIPALGRALEASQVIYVDLIQSSVEGDATRGI